MCWMLLRRDTSGWFAGVVWLALGALMLVAGLLLLIPAWDNVTAAAGLSIQQPLLDPTDDKYVLALDSPASESMDEGPVA